MPTIQEWIQVLLALLPAAAGVRAVIICLRMQTDPDQASLYKRRLVNLLVFAVIAECALGLMYVLFAYLR